MKSNFTLDLGSGMTMLYYYDCEVEIEIIIENSEFSHNTSWYGGVFISLPNSSYSIKFSNCTIYDNTAQYREGMYIILNNGSGSTEYSSCTMYNNTAYYGSGLFIITLKSTSPSSIHFTNVFFHFNILPNKLNIYQSAVLLMNIENVILTKLRLIIIT